MPYADKEKGREYANKWRREARRKRGLQKSGRKPYTEEEKVEAKEKRKEWEKSWTKEYYENNTELSLLYASRRRAKNKGLEHTITVEDIIIPTHCPYLGIELQMTNRDKGTCRSAWPTLDRKDNTKGYTKDNIEVISFKANTMKNNATNEELVLFAKQLLCRLTY